MPKRRNGVTAIFRARKRPCTATACHATASRRNSPPKPPLGAEVQTYTICPLARDDPPSRAVAFGMPSGGGLPSTGALDCSSEQLAAANSIPNTKPIETSVVNGDNYIRRLRKDVAKRRLERAAARSKKPTPATGEAKREDKAIVGRNAGWTR